MNIVWAGGEDIDFKTGPGAVVVDGTAGRFRSGYARYAVEPASSSFIQSTPFAEQTSFWFSCRLLCARDVTGYYGNVFYLGLAKSGNTTQKGIFLATETGAQNDSYPALVRLIKYTGSVRTELAQSVANELGGALNKVDIHVQNYGVNATVDVYWDARLIISYTGDISIAGVNGLDCIQSFRAGAGNFAVYPFISECVVADSDTRSLSVVTHYPSAAGDLNEWDGTGYAGIDESTLDITDMIYTDVNNEKCITALSDCPAGDFVPQAVVVTAYCAKSASGPITKIKLGIKSGGTEDVDAGQSAAIAASALMRVMPTINGNPITTAILNAAQLEIVSLT
jgi:hypothetical protein